MSKFERKTELTSFAIFSDGSFDPKSKRGVGAYCILPGPLEIVKMEFSVESCARLELLAVLWALESFMIHIEQTSMLSLYTDSRTIAELDGRRAKLTANHFKSRRTGELLSNGDLYRDFFAICDEIRSKTEMEIIWVKGHTPSEGRTREQEIFSQVDHAARVALRELLPS